MADKDTNYLEMSDEEMLNAPEPTLPTEEEEKPVVEATDTEETEEVTETVAETEKTDEEEEENSVLDTADEDLDDEQEEETDDAAEVEAVAETDDAEEVDEKEEVKDKKPVETKGKSEKTEAVKPATEEDNVDYKAEYNKLLAPFKANGRDIKPKSVEDAISLMQMGANYNKKMAAIKPNLKIMKLLENNDLLDEQKLSFLIDLDKKSPEAIHKLIKDSGINPMDIDTEKESEYVPKSRSVDDRELMLDSVLEDISDTDSYDRTLNIVSKEWDGASKQVVANAPELLRVINDHVSSGIYDIIQAEVESERVFGRLNGKSDIEAYKLVGDAIEASGGFNHLNKSSVTTETKKPVVVARKTKVVSDELKEKRRAAGNTKPTSPTTAKQDYNPLAMSDEEFNNISASR